MENEEIIMNEAAQAEQAQAPVQEEAPVEIQFPQVPVEEGPAITDETIAEELSDSVENVEGEAVGSEVSKAFDGIKARLNDLKDNELPILVDELKKRGFEVKEKGLEYARKLGESGEAYKAKVKARSEGMKKDGHRDELLYQIGEVAYDGHKSGEDVAAVLEYLFRKLDEIED